MTKSKLTATKVFTQKARKRIRSATNTAATSTRAAENAENKQTTSYQNQNKRENESSAINQTTAKSSNSITIPWYSRFTKNDSCYNTYMANEWSIEVRQNDRALFEKLCLEGAQAGLSWRTILHKREAYRSSFHGFDIEKVSQMTLSDIDKLMNEKCSNPTTSNKRNSTNNSLVKHRGKLESVIHNAKCVLTMSERDNKFTTFSDYIWSFVDNKPILNHWKKVGDIPSKTYESEQMSKGLKSHGFKFVGPTTCYSLMQSCGLVIDHPADTPEWKAALKRLKQRDGGYQTKAGNS